MLLIRGVTPSPRLSANVLATHHLFDALSRTGTACRVVVSGSATVYAASTAALTEESPIAPSNPYAVSKLVQEQLAFRAAREDGVEVIVTRSFNHTGPRQRPAFAAPNMARQIALIEAGVADPVIKTGNLDAQRDITDVRDMARAYIALLHRVRPSTLYNVASGTTSRDAIGARGTRRACPCEGTRRNRRRADAADRHTIRAGRRHEAARDNRMATGDLLRSDADDLLNYWRSITPA
jgi:nucleoside-diphosphate-sugar epimerase